MEARRRARAEAIQELLGEDRCQEAMEQAAQALAQESGDERFRALLDQAEACREEQRRQERRSADEAARRERTSETARRLVEAGDLEGAVALLAGARREFSDPAPLDLERARLALVLGERYLESGGDPERALDAFTRARVAAALGGKRADEELVARARAGQIRAREALDRAALRAGLQATRRRVSDYLSAGEVLRAIDLLQELGEAGEPSAEQEALRHLRAYLARDLIDVGGGTVTLHLPGGLQAVDVAPFRIGIREVTVGDYARYLAVTGRSPPPAWRARPPVDLELPVTGLNRQEAESFASWLGLRLPTEAEWQRAAQGLDGRLFPWGVEPRAGGRAHVAPPLPEPGDGSWSPPQGPLPCGSLPRGASPYGCLDMAGNVAEWTSSHWSGEVTGLTVVRGGGWTFGLCAAESTHRMGVPPTLRHEGVGFRLAGEVR
jgi:tetratricopeptide (TPR) repeat protein